MPQTNSDWTCEQCKHSFVNIIKWESVKPGEKSKPGLIVCPDCG